MCGRVEGCHRESTILEIIIVKHGGEHADENRLEQRIKAVSSVGKRVPKSLDDHPANGGIRIAKERLKISTRLAGEVDMANQNLD